MVLFNRGQLIQHINYNGEATPDEEAGRILDPIIDTTNTFTGAYLVCLFSSFRLSESRVKGSGIGST